MVGEFSLSGGLGRIVPFFRVQKICFLLHKRNFTICFRFQIYGVFCRLAAGEKGLYMRKAATLKVLPLFILQKIRYRAGRTIPALSGLLGSSGCGSFLCFDFLVVVFDETTTPRFQDKQCQAGADCCDTCRQNEGTVPVTAFGQTGCQRNNKGRSSFRGIQRTGITCCIGTTKRIGTHGREQREDFTPACERHTRT